MKKISPNSTIRAAARAQLIGKYPIVAFAYLISDFILSAAMQVSRLQLDLSKTYTIIIYLIFQLNAIHLQKLDCKLHFRSHFKTLNHLLP